MGSELPQIALRKKISVFWVMRENLWAINVCTHLGQSVSVVNVTTGQMVWGRHTPVIWWFVKRLSSDIYLEFAFFVHEQVASPKQRAFIPAFSQVSGTFPSVKSCPCGTGTWGFSTFSCSSGKNSITKKERHSICTSVELIHGVQYLVDVRFAPSKK